MELERFHYWNCAAAPDQSLQPSHLVFDANFGSQGVFCAPLLGERQPVLCPLVLGFQVSRDFAVVDVGGSGRFKLLDAGKKTKTKHQISTAGTKTTNYDSLQLVEIKYS